MLLYRVGACLVLLAVMFPPWVDASGKLDFFFIAGVSGYTIKADLLLVEIAAIFSFIVLIGWGYGAVNTSASHHSESSRQETADEHSGYVPRPATSSTGCPKSQCLAPQPRPCGHRADRQ